MIKAKFTKEYFERNENVFNFLDCLLRRKEHDYEVHDSQLTQSIYNLQDIIKEFENNTGYELSVRIRNLDE